MRSRWGLLGLALALGVPAACSDDAPNPGEARLEVDGEALVERADGERDSIDGSTDLKSGDRVTMQAGTAIMQLSGGSTFELRAGLEEEAATKVLMARRPVLEAGDLLVTTPDRVGLEADGTDVEVAEGAARVTRAFGMGVAAYDADVALDSAGVDAAVPALREMVVPDLGQPPRAVRPFSYDAEDPWDRRFLGAAIALGRSLDKLSEDLTAQVPANEGDEPAFYRLLLPGLRDDQSLDDELADTDRARPAGETLVGAAITDLGRRGSFADRWDAVFTFRDDGAEWGLVALDQAVRSDPLVSSVNDAFDVSFAGSLLDDPAPVSPGDVPADNPEPGDPSSPTTTTTLADDPSDPSDPSPPVDPSDPPPVIPPPDPEPPPAIEPVVEPVTDLVDDLLGGLLG